MAKLVALNNKQHQHLHIDTQLAEAEGADLHLVPVVLSEFMKLVVSYPIVFSKNGDTGEFMCSALMGLEEGENLFYEKGQWQSIYIPLQLARQPFFLGHDNQAVSADNSSSEQAQNLVMCINESHASVISQASTNTHSAPNHNETQEPLFNETGEATSYLQAQQNRLVQLLQGEQQTHDFIATLLDMQLITAIALEITLADGSSHKVNGLYSIDEEKLAQISDAQLILLKQKHYLSPIYTLIASTSHIYSLINKKNQRIEQGAKWFQAATL
ncbi:SapC family protein [Alteromonas sp. a30]|uniref:SapC family protein n=1 Tax=Alteromonas sp. a30 TaxID=2730917 RepID=UPI002282A462|nr:SapC family protein [Alteromonas sp. a30]MCY7297328.1 SapC family protein [Alteromonas sp. a30]